MRRALRDFLPVLAVAAAFLVAWKLLVVIGGYPAFVLPAPEVVATRLVGAWRDGVMQPHVLTTLSEVLLGFAIGSSLALVTGYTLARSRLAERPPSWRSLHSWRSGSGRGSSPRSSSAR